MKKIISFLLICFISLFFISCTDNSNPRETKEIEIVDDKYRNYYEIFVHSFYDSNKDGIGDLNGVTQKLDYVKDMGFNGIWLMPITKGQSYHKYDVLDYYNVDPSFGTLADFSNLITEAHKRGIDVILDLVVNHTSSKHEWFTNAANFIKRYGEPGGDFGDYFNFTTQGKTGFSMLAGTSYYYEAQFWSEMPDLNLDNEKVRAEIAKIMKYWLELGCDGFRLDAVTSYYTNEVDKNVEFLSWLNTEAKKVKEDAYIVGEAWINSDISIRRYYDSGIDSFFQFTLSQGEGSLAQIVRDNNRNRGESLTTLFKSLDRIYNTGILAPFLSNHDTNRITNFIGSANFAKLKFIHGLLSLCNGNTFVYYGEEIGMVSANSDPNRRLPIRWSIDDPTGKVTVLPDGGSISSNTYKFGSVEDNIKDPDSILNYYKYANYIRNANPEIARGKTTYFDSYTQENKNIAVFQRVWNDKKITIVVNLDEEATTEVKLDKEALGFSEMTQFLCATVTNRVKFNSGSNTVSLAPYSIAIFR